MLGNIISALGGMAGSWLGKELGPKVPGLDAESGKGLGSALGGDLASMVGPSAGTMAGQKANDYFKELGGGKYNAWDKLGASSPGGQLQAVEKQTKTQERMQSKELEARKDVARIQGENAVRTARVAHGSEDTPQLGIDRIKGGNDKLIAEVNNLLHMAQRTKHQARSEKVQADLLEKIPMLKAAGLLGIFGGGAGALWKWYQAAKKAKTLKKVGVGSAASVGGNRARAIGSTHMKTPPRPITVTQYKGVKPMPKHLMPTKVRPNKGPPVKPGGIRDRAMKGVAKRRSSTHRKSKPYKGPSWTDQDSKWAQ